VAVVVVHQRPADVDVSEVIQRTTATRLHQRLLARPQPSESHRPSVWPQLIEEAALLHRTRPPDEDLVTRLRRDLGPGRHHIGLRIIDTRALVTCSVAVARTGMVSVPIDPNAPPDRLAHVVTDADVALLLSDTEDDLALELDAPVTHAGTYRADYEGPTTDVPVAADEPVAIVFTSGSTGVPKGIAIPPAQRVAQAAWARDLYPEALRVGILEVGTVGFMELLIHGIVAAGGTMIPYPIRTAGLAPWRTGSSKSASKASSPSPPSCASCCPPWHQTRNSSTCSSSG
jgi:non-ribosomal peptide synthetase component F